MTLTESHMLAKESQTNRVNKYDSFSAIMTLLRERSTPFIFSVYLSRIDSTGGGAV